jgi:ABC-2 type transport system permease protein
MNVALAFLLRDFRIAVSYRTAFALQLLSIFVAVPVFHFIGSLVDSSQSDLLKPYGGNYFAFILIGVALLDYLAVSLRSFAQSLRESQLMGTLEIVLLSPTSLIEVLIYSSLWFYLFTSIRFALYLLVGTLFGFDLGQSNVIGALAILVLGILSFIPFGIATASLIMLIKRGEILNTLVSGASLFFGGVLYPIATLPEWLQLVSKLLPFTYALEGMRQALQQGKSLEALLPELGILALFTAFLLPLSLLLFWASVQRTKTTGTLAQY